jgi:TonB family protein
MDMRIKFGFLILGLATLLTGWCVVRPLSAQDAAPAADAAAKRKVKTKVAPDYPALAKQMNIYGKVRIEAVIAADGHVISTRVVGGSPVLVNAAVDALKKWRFEPAPKDSIEIIEFAFGV